MIADLRARFDASTPFARRLAVIVAIGWLARVIYILIERRPVGPANGDALFYHLAANDLADGRGFLNPFFFREHGVVEPAADHPPLYIVYLAGWSLLGVDGPTGHMLASSIFGTITVVAVGLVARRLAGERAGLIAAGIAVVYPNVWSHDGMLLSESVALAMVTLLVLAVLRFADHPSPGRAALMGVVLALAALSRSETLLLALLVVTPACLSARVGPWGDRVRHLVIAGSACVVVLAPWVAHNLTRFEDPVYLSAGFEVTLASANCPETYEGEKLGYWSLQCVVDYVEDAGIEPTADQSRRSEVVLDGATDFISDNADRVPAVVLARWGRITGLYRPVQQANLDVLPEGRDRWVARTSLALWYPVALLAVAGAVVLHRRGGPTYVLLGPPITVLVAVTLTFATHRYRATAETSLCILAAVAVDAWFRRRRRATVPAREPTMPAA